MIYFYSSADTSVDVTVRFPQGPLQRVVSIPLPSCNRPPTNGCCPCQRPWARSCNGKNVRILPLGRNERYPIEGKSSHYYAAQRTDAAQVDVGSQREKFLLYRGVGSFPVPIAAALAEEDTVVVTNLADRPVPESCSSVAPVTTCRSARIRTLDKEIALTRRLRQSVSNRAEGLSPPDPGRGRTLSAQGAGDARDLG